MSHQKGAAPESDGTRAPLPNRPSVPGHAPESAPPGPPPQSDADRHAVITAMLDQLTRELDQDVILQQAVRAIVRLGRWDSIGISVLTPDGRHWQTRAGDSLAPGEVMEPYPLTRGVVGRAYSTGAVQFVPEVAADPDFFIDNGVSGAGSELVVPISFDGQMLGAINLESDRPHAFGPDDMAFAQATARILAIALKNAQRFDALRQENAERRRAEEAQRSLLLNLEAAEAQAGLGSWWFDVRTGARWWSRQMYSLFRRDPAAGVPDDPDYLDLIHPEDRELLATTLAEMAAGRTSDLHPFRTNPAYGPVRILSPRYRVEHGPDGTPAAFFGTILDITERTYAEEETRWARDLFTRLFHSSPIATIFTSLPDRTILDVNDAAVIMMGYARRELIGCTTADLMLFADPSAEAEVQATLAERGRVSAYECRLLDRDREARDCSLYIEPLTIHGKVYTLTQIVDVSERKRAEEALRASEAQYRYLFDHNPHPMWAYDLETMAFLAVNDAAVAKYGYTRAEFLAMTIADIRPPEDVARLRADMARPREVLQHSEGWRHRLKDGTLIDVEISSHRITLGGREAALVVAQDITARKRAEDALRASEEQYRGLMESLDSAVMMVDAAGVLRYMNDPAARQLGGASHDLVGKTLHELLAWPVAEAQLEPMRAAMRENRTVVHESLALVQGEPRWQRTTFRPLHDRAGAVMGAIINATDIHELKTAQQQLLELNRTLEERVRARTAEVRDLYEKAPAGYHSLDAQGRFLMVNETELGWLGYTRDELIGRSFAEVITEASRAVFTTNYPLFRRRGWVRDLEFELVRKDGTTFPVLLSATAIYDEAGHFVMSRSTLLDTTDRKRAEDALRESQARLQDFLDTASDLILSVDVTGAIGYVNSAWCAALGYSPEESRALTLCEVVAPEYQERCREALSALIASGGPRQIEVLLRTKGGATVMIEGSASVWTSRDGQPTINGIFRDVTRRRQAEEALRLANAELERALRTKDEFLANMSHELRTPLNAILALSEVLQEGLRGPLNERQHESLGHIEASGKHLLSLINDILDLSKVEAGRLDLMLEPVPIAEVCRASLQFVKELALKKQLQLALHLSDELAVCEADPKRLKQMLVNLLSNAVKFTPAGGAVSLEVMVAPEAGVMTLSVSDTGIGIAPEELPRLFQPFTQLDARLSRHHEGTGLGLVLVRRLAELHGGSVAVESEQGRGSRFTVVLPYRPPQPAPQARPEARRPLRSALVVDDSLSAVEQLTRYLGDLGVEVVTHAEASEALDTARDLRPDLVVLDLLMPGHSGWEIMAHLREDPRISATPVLIVTVVDERARGLAAGAAGYLVKPITHEALRQALEAIGFDVHQAGAAPEARPGGLRVLVAEDNEVNLEVMRDFLAAKGHTVAVARDGAAAVAMATAAPPDIILMDIQMPELDGLEATRRLRATAACATTPIIALTALAMPGDRERCLEAGANAYLTKPVRLTELAEVMRRLTADAFS